MKFARSRYVRHVLVPVMAASLLSACGHWKVQEMSPRQVILDTEPKVVRLTMLDETEIEVSEPQIRNDQIVGEDVKTRYGADPAPVRVPIDSVSVVATRDTNWHTVSTVGWISFSVGFFYNILASGWSIWYE